KGNFSFFGIKSTERRAIQKQIISECGLPKPFDPIVFEAFWSAQEMWFQMAGLDILRRQAQKCDASDIQLIENLIITKSWWDSVDGLSSWVCGPFFLKFPKQMNPITDRWADSENMWKSQHHFPIGLQGQDGC
ncbi:MAG: 3-methyladenine DNA glycosylase AlkD, partial [Flavobacteriales bacterium]